MKTIWKFALEITDEPRIKMPHAAEILCVQVQDGSPFVWAIVDEGRPPEVRRFKLFGTGHDVPDELGRYVGTFQVHGGRLVFHLFEAM